MSPGAAGAANISCVWHRRSQQGPTMSVDVAPPNPRKDSVAVSLGNVPSYMFFRPGSAPASPEALAGQVGARHGTNSAPSGHETAEGRAAAAAAAGSVTEGDHCYLCLQPEAEERDALRNVEGLLLCSCCCLGLLEQYSKDVAARPAVTAGGHPKFGCPGCLPGPRAKLRPGGKTKMRFSSGKKARRNKKLEASRSKAEEAAATVVAAAQSAGHYWPKLS